MVPPAACGYVYCGQLMVLPAACGSVYWRAAHGATSCLWLGLLGDSTLCRQLPVVRSTWGQHIVPPAACGYATLVGTGDLEPRPNVSLKLGHCVYEALGPAYVQHRGRRPLLPHADAIVKLQQRSKALGVLKI